MPTLIFIVKNLGRHKLRNGLTLLGIVVTILSFGLLRTVVDAWYVGVEASSNTRLVTRNAISIIFSLPKSYAEKIRQTEGVRQLSWGTWFGGIYVDEKNFFPNFAVDAKTYFQLYSELVLPEDQLKGFTIDRKGCVAGHKLAERFGWKLGDQIVLKGTIYPGEWPMTLRGIYKGKLDNVDRTQLFFHWDYLNETMKKVAPSRSEQVGFYLIGIDLPENAAPISLAVDEHFHNSRAETLTETEQAFQAGFIAMSEAIVVAIRMVSYIVIVIIMAVAANTMAMSARERLGEFSVLRALGFGRGYLALLIFGESMTISLIGCGLGILLTFPAATAFGSSLSQYFPVFKVSETTVRLQIAAAFVVGAVAGVVPALRAGNIRIADGLRRIG